MYVNGGASGNDKKVNNPICIVFKYSPKEIEILAFTLFVRPHKTKELIPGIIKIYDLMDLQSIITLMVLIYLIESNLLHYQVKRENDCTSKE